MKNLKNLADFKRSLISAQQNKTLIRVERREVYKIFPAHPWFNTYGPTRTEIASSTRYVRDVQSASFSTMYENQPEARNAVWMDFGKAKQWTFSDNTATCTDNVGSEKDGAIFALTISFTFIE